MLCSLEFFNQTLHVYFEFIHNFTTFKVFENVHAAKLNILVCYVQNVIILMFHLLISLSCIFNQFLMAIVYINSHKNSNISAVVTVSLLCLLLQSLHNNSSSHDCVLTLPQLMIFCFLNSDFGYQFSVVKVFLCC